jgi:Protein of unknown function (DUF1501)
VLTRRTFLRASMVGSLGLAGGTAQAAGSARPLPTPKAKSTILFFLCGGSSHVDMWDLKPQAPVEYRSEFEPISTTASGITLCEHLPRTAEQAHHLAIVRSISDFGKATGDHHAGYYFNLTGHVPDETFRTQGNDRRPYPGDWPFMGSVVAAQRPLHESLPQTITLPHKPSKAPYTRPGQFAARLGAEHDPFYLQSDPAKPMQFLAPTLSLEGGLTQARMQDRHSLRTALDHARAAFDKRFESSRDRTNEFEIQHEKAFALLSSSLTSAAFDLSQETIASRERYGETINGRSLLMARRLVEAGVPFVTVFWKEDESIAERCKSAGGWDTHGNNFNCLKQNLLPEFDRGYSALLADLHERGLLESTLVVVSSEMGRKPKIGDPRSGGVSGSGRDHWTACMSVVLAGGGLRGGQTYGKTDKYGEYPVENAVNPGAIL